jgi:hypothetical protein
MGDLTIDMRIILKWIWCSVVDQDKWFCDYLNEPSSYIKGVSFFNHLSYCQLLAVRHWWVRATRPLPARAIEPRPAVNLPTYTYLPALHLGPVSSSSFPPPTVLSPLSCSSLADKWWNSICDIPLGDRARLREPSRRIIRPRTQNLLVFLYLRTGREQLHLSSPAMQSTCEDVAFMLGTSLVLPLYRNPPPHGPSESWSLFQLVPHRKHITSLLQNPTG